MSGQIKAIYILKVELCLSLISWWTFAPETDSLNERVRKKTTAFYSKFFVEICLSFSTLPLPDALSSQDLSSCLGESTVHVYTVVIP